MKRLVSLVLAVVLILGVSAPVGAFNIWPGWDRWSINHVSGYARHSYVCLNGAWPGGIYGSKANIAVAGVQQWNNKSADLRYDTTWNRQCVSGLANQYILHWGESPEHPGAIGASVVNRRNGANEYVEVETYFSANPVYTANEWWSTGIQSCVNRQDNSPTDCKMDMYAAATHEAGHAMGLRHRPQPEGTGTDCTPGYWYTSTASACLPVNDGIYGMDIMWAAGVDGYYRRLTQDDIAGCRYLYGSLVG